MQENSRSLNDVLALASNTHWKLDCSTSEFRKIIKALKVPYSKRTSTHLSKTLLYKTQMCANILTLGYCKYGSECWFAHRVNELRSVPSNSSNTQHFSKSSNGCVFDFMSETFQHQQPCTSSSISANTTTEGTAPRLFSESHIEEAFYSVPNRIINHNP
ncbi:hypothetical protein GPALN_005467 [Globodera pallida]|nr:hypothetical protein GPALN_005467 [Globodera pallida]